MLRGNAPVLVVLDLSVGIVSIMCQMHRSDSEGLVQNLKPSVFGLNKRIFLDGCESVELCGPRSGLQGAQSATHLCVDGATHREGFQGLKAERALPEIITDLYLFPGLLIARWLYWVKVNPPAAILVLLR